MARFYSENPSTAYNLRLLDQPANDIFPGDKAQPGAIHSSFRLSAQDQVAVFRDDRVFHGGLTERACALPWNTEFLPLAVTERFTVHDDPPAVSGLLQAPAVAGDGVDGFAQRIALISLEFQNYHIETADIIALIIILKE